jgi:hypothetical protein
MDNQTTTETNITQIIIGQAISAWDAQNKAVSKFFEGENLDRINEVIAPGKNRIGYILGHLIAVNDAMLPILGLGEKIYPEMLEFIRKPDKELENIPSGADLLQRWDEVNARLSDNFNQMTPADWLERHTRVSEEDFAKEPHRNKLNILLNRTGHTAYHVGQLALAKPAGNK